MTLPNIGSVLGNIFSSGASKLVEAVGTALDKNITSKDEKEKNQIELTKVINDGLSEIQKQVDDANETSQKELTARLQIDMTSDSKLSKNIRPITLIYLSVVVTLLAILDSSKIGFDIKPMWVDLFKYAYMAVLSFYFLARGIEKITALKNQ